MTDPAATLKKIILAEWTASGAASLKQTASRQVQEKIAAAVVAYWSGIADHAETIMTAEERQLNIRFQQAAIIDFADSLLATLRPETAISNGRMDTWLAGYPGHRLLLRSLMDLLDAMALHYTGYFNPELKVSRVYCYFQYDDLLGEFLQLKEIFTRLKQDELLLACILIPPVSHRHNGGRCPSFRQLQYYRILLRTLGKITSSPTVSMQAITDELCYINFNHKKFVTWYFTQLSSELEDCPDYASKELYLAGRLKHCRQLVAREDIAFLPGQPPLLGQLSNWVCEELAFIRLKRKLQVRGHHSDVPQMKLQTSLNVQQLAAFIAILIATGVIVTNNMSAVLRVFTSTMTTVGTDQISFESLRSKYYSLPVKVMDHLRDLLQKMIRESRKIG